MKTLSTYFNLMDAYQARSWLVEGGFDVFIPDENSSSTLPFQSFIGKGIRLQVPDEQAEAADKRLKAMPSGINPSLLEDEDT